MSDPERRELEQVCLRRYAKSLMTQEEHTRYTRLHQVMAGLTTAGAFVLPGLAFLVGQTQRQRQLFYLTGAFVTSMAALGVSQHRMQEEMTAKYLRRFSSEELRRFDEVLLDQALHLSSM